MLGKVSFLVGLYAACVSLSKMCHSGVAWDYVKPYFFGVQLHVDELLEAVVQGMWFLWMVLELV